MAKRNIQHEIDICVDNIYKLNCHRKDAEEFISKSCGAKVCHVCINFHDAEGVLVSQKQMSPRNFRYMMELMESNFYSMTRSNIERIGELYVEMEKEKKVSSAV